MKCVGKLLIFVSFIMFLISCNKNATSNHENVEKAPSFKIQMATETIPSEVFKIEGKLLREGFDSLTTDFVFEQDYATADFGEIFAGEWLLKVTAFSQDNSPLYFGETLVQIYPNQNNVVNLHLDPVTGTLQVNVTWGNSQEENLVAYYPFNGNANDESDFDNHGSVFGASLTYDRFQNPYSAYYFNGYNSYIAIPHASQNNFDTYTDSYSISLWVKSQTSSTARIIQKWDEHLVTPYPFSIRTHGDSCYTSMYDGIAYTPKISFGTIWDGQWHHIVMVIDQSDSSLKTYLDGAFVKAGNIPVTQSTANTFDIHIGRANILNDRFFCGSIDDIGMYNYSLTLEDILLLYQHR